MNYIELHIGDYDKATAHLTGCEDGMYGRLLRRYYDTEEPLPLEIKAVQRLVRARSREEKEAVETILDEFFLQSPDGWRHKRCDEEIDRYNQKRAKAKRSAEVRWQASERNANASANVMRTHSEGNAHQTPDTRHQSPDKSSSSQSEIPKGSNTHTARATPPSPSAVGAACRAMRDAGIASTNGEHPELHALIVAGATPAQFAQAAAHAVTKGKGFAYALGTLKGQLADAAAPKRGNAEAIHDHNRRVADEWLAADQGATP